MNGSMRRGAQGGFIRKLMFFTIMACIMFIVLVALAKYVGPQATGVFDGGFNSNSGSALTPPGNNPLLSFLNTSGDYGSSGGSVDTSSIPAGSRSLYAGQVSLGPGNASYSVQPYQEYVTLRNNGSSRIDITGWTLTNGKGTRPIQNRENDYLYPVADSATIGRGADFLDPSASYKMGDIYLNPGDSAIVTTGQSFSQFPYPIPAAFRENVCDGYLKNYPFEPALSLSCPNPTNDPAISSVTNECYDYLQGLNQCEDPEKYDKDNFDAETGPCRSFMHARLNYPNCVAMHRSDAGFSLNQWRIFLGKPRELWASQRETITLYDSSGKIVDQLGY